MDNLDLDTLINKNIFSPERKKKTLFLIIIIIIITIINIGVSIYYFIKYSRMLKYDDGSSEFENDLYGCMCDAGSSGTRVNVYHWPERKPNNIPLISEMGRNRTSSGIHEMNETTLVKTMDILIDYCKNRIIELSHNKCNLSKVNFYLKATAGMRSISEEEQNQKLNIIRNTIKKSPFRLLNDDWVKVINGSEEGLFGWITSNYLNKILLKNEEDGKQNNIPYGSIDLGGYSLEITFTTNETIKEHNINLNFTNINYNIYSYSFQDYGQQRFYDIFMESIFNSSNHENSNIIVNPCFLEGYSEIYKSNNISYKFIGSGNIELCQKKIKSIMNINEEKEKSMNNIYQPIIPENLKFYGISGLYWIAKFFNIADDEFHSASELLNVTEEFCNTKWEDALKKYSKDIDPEYLKKYCFLGYYVYFFLVEGFKIDKDKKLLIFPEKINGIETGWTLGAMSFEIGLLPLQANKILNY